MKIIIQCAGRKKKPLPKSGFRTSDNRLIQFVANPNLAPDSEIYAYKKPEDIYNGSDTWRDEILEYNKNPISNPLQLFPAYQLYADHTYRNLVEKFGIDQIYILSAGWGLIPANFLIPDYDITFSHGKNVAQQCHRKKTDYFKDFCLLPDDGDDIIFLGGQSYLPLFCELVGKFQGRKKILYRLNSDLDLGPEFITEKYVTKRVTNWHYECAKMIIEGHITI